MPDQLDATALLAALRERFSEYVVDTFQPHDRALRATLREMWRGEQGTEPGSYGLIARPLVEATFPYEAEPVTLEDLEQQGDVPAALVELASAGRQRSDLVLPHNVKLFAHQLQVLRLLRDHRGRDGPRPSVIIQAGTGSGKTEAFLLPLLAELLDEPAETRRQPGVRAILVYPLT